MFERNALIAACKNHGTVSRVVVADVQGSAPREVGAAMLVWADGQSGTIGGGALEYELAQRARAGSIGFSKHALGPDMGQCCGGAVQMLTERYDLAAALALPSDLIARGPGDMPLAIAKLLNHARNEGTLPVSHRIGDWFVEPVLHPKNSLWIWGAGHVGRALVSVLAPLPDLDITWVDTAENRFPDARAPNVTILPAHAPDTLIQYAPVSSHHLILTYSHAIDLALCHGILSHEFASCGVIGSTTKWTRFRKRLAALGHTDVQISRITCPIGDPRLGKHPQMIAIGVADQLIKRVKSTITQPHDTALEATS
jgi:xanthine dehydrogenase accessory factor